MDKYSLPDGTVVDAATAKAWLQKHHGKTGKYEFGSFDYSTGTTPILEVIEVVNTDKPQDAATSMSGDGLVRSSFGKAFSDLFKGIVPRVGMIAIVGVIIYVMYRNYNKFKPVVDRWLSAFSLDKLAKKLGFLSPQSTVIANENIYAIIDHLDEVRYTRAELANYMEEVKVLEQISRMSAKQLALVKVVLDNIDAKKILMFEQMKRDADDLEHLSRASGARAQISVR